MQRSKLFSCLILAAAFLTGSASADILLPGERLFPQAVTATRDGALYVGIGSGVVKVTPGAAQVDPLPVAVGAIRSFAFDERGQSLWACADGPSGKAALKVIDVRSGKLRNEYVLDNNGDCADVTIGRDGTVYLLDSANSAVLRLKRGDEKPLPWLTNDESLRRLGSWSALSVDNLGGIYLLGRDKGSLQRVALRWDGSAGNLVDIKLDRPLNKPVALKPMAEAASKQIDPQSLGEDFTTPLRPIGSAEITHYASLPNVTDEPVIAAFRQLVTSEAFLSGGGISTECEAPAARRTFVELIAANGLEQPPSSED